MVNEFVLTNPYCSDIKGINPSLNELYEEFNILQTLESNPNFVYTAAMT